MAAVAEETNCEPNSILHLRQTEERTPENVTSSDKANFSLSTYARGWWWWWLCGADEHELRIRCECG